MLGLLMFTLDFGSLFIHERHKKRMIEFLVGSYQIENLYSPHNSDSSSDKIDTKYTTKIIKINLIRT